MIRAADTDRTSAPEHGGALPASPIETPLPYLRANGYLTATRRGSRSLALVLAIAIHALLAGVLLVRWSVARPEPAQPTLSVFDVEPPAAAPEPRSEAPSDPEEMRKEERRPEPDRPRIEPAVQVPDDDSLSSPTPQPPASDPGPPVEKSTPRESRSLPPPPQRSNAGSTWQGLVLGALGKVKRYPRDAQFAGRQGVPYIRFVVDREGRVLSSRLERSSGVPSLDREAVALPKRASPLPKPPGDLQPGEAAIELVVPVEFFMR